MPSQCQLAVHICQKQQNYHIMSLNISLSPTKPDDKFKINRGRKLTRSFYLDEPQEALTAKNQLFDFSEHIDTNHSRTKQNYQVDTPDESFHKNFTSWNGQSLSNEQKNNKKNLTWTRAFQKIEKHKAKRELLKSACDLNNKAIKIFEMAAEQNPQQKRELHFRQNIKKKIVTISPYIDEKIKNERSESMTKTRKYRKSQPCPSNFLRTGYSNNKKKIETKYDNLCQSIQSIDKWQAPKTFKTKSMLKNKKNKGKWVGPPTNSTNIKRVYQLEQTPLKSEFIHIVNLLKKEKCIN